MKNTAVKMAARADKVRNPNNTGVVKPARGKPKIKLVVAIGTGPTLGTNSSKTFNKGAQRIKK